MDKVKYIKLEQEDGSYSESIPLSVDSDYVDVNGQSLTVELNRIDNLETQINKKPYYYVNIATMKTDINLEEGDVIQTLGYYEANDGGSGLYEIVDDENLVDDGGSIHELDNGLFAQLIVDHDGINIKQFGAKSFTVTSESNIQYDETIDEPLQKAIDYIFNLATTNKNKSYNFNILIPAGNYAFEEEIELSPLVHLVPIGSVVLYWNNTSGQAKTAIKIGTLSTELDPYARNDIYARFLNPIIGSETGNIELQSILTAANNNDEGILVGALSNVSVAELSCLKNITIKKFHTGLNLRLHNLYLNRFDNVRLNGCVAGLKTSVGEESINSGENLLFNRGSISNCDTALLFEDGLINLKFTDTSFDGDGCLAYQTINLNAELTFVRCWIEAIGNAMGSQHLARDYNGKQDIVYITPYDGNVTEYLKTTYIFTECRYTDSSSIHQGSVLKHLFSGNTLKLILDNFKYATWNAYADTTPRYLCDDNVAEVYYKNYINSGYAVAPFIKNKNLLQYPTFAYSGTGAITPEVGKKIGRDLSISALENIGSINLINDSFSGSGKIIEITKTDNTAAASITLKTVAKIYCKNSDILGRIYIKDTNNTKQGLTQSFKNNFYDSYDNSAGNTYCNYNSSRWVKDEYNFYYPTVITQVNSSAGYTNCSYTQPTFTINLDNTSAGTIYLKMPEIFDYANTAVIV